ncbi:MAG: serine/threonine protein kinase [Myxococcales bacterium]|nr:MAG: serine/threonine protein kinase [Myxococcales bacterium]
MSDRKTVAERRASVQERHSVPNEEEQNRLTRLSWTEKHTIGGYELVELLGVGGMGQVYLARKTGPGGFEKWVALKRIHPKFVGDPTYINMFLDEARIAASIHHPNVAQVYDLGMQGEEYYLTMEYLNGEHLASLLNKLNENGAMLDVELAAFIVAQAARGLHYAHEAKNSAGQKLELVHRDISPQNIFITYGGEVKITDFGVAHAINRISKTRTGGIKGKSPYMAPEQVLGLDMDRRADVFALGAVLWESLIGSRLFQGKTDGEILMKVAKAEIPDPKQFRPDLPQDLVSILLRALAKEPGDRFAHAQAMEEELNRFLHKRTHKVDGVVLSQQMNKMFEDERQIKDDLRVRSSQMTTASGVTALSVEADAPISHLRSAPTLKDTTRASETLEEQNVQNEGKGKTLQLAVLAVLLMGVIALFASSFFEQKPVSKHLYGTVYLQSEPSGAEVTIDQIKQPGNTPLSVKHLNTGRHQLNLRLEGFQEKQASFDLDEGNTKLRYTLVPLKPQDAKQKSQVTTRQGQAFVNILSRPWATVKINGQLAGQTPLIKHKVPSGPLVIELQAEGVGATKTLHAKSKPGQTLSFNENL